VVANQRNAPKPPKQLDVELLALDLNACSRCAGTAANVRAVLTLARDLFREVGTEVVYRETVVGSADQAERLRFVSSPTVRINGRDVTAESRESLCADCGGLCGCGDGVNCRVWTWDETEHLEAPRALLLDALLNAYAESGPRAEAEYVPFRLPENLRAFFVARDHAAAHDAKCCDEQACCDPADKSECCGEGDESPTCGCQ